MYSGRTTKIFPLGLNSNCSRPGNVTGSNYGVHPYHSTRNCRHLGLTRRYEVRSVPSLPGECQEPLPLVKIGPKKLPPSVRVFLFRESRFSPAGSRVTDGRIRDLVLQDTLRREGVVGGAQSKYEWIFLCSLEVENEEITLTRNTPRDPLYTRLIPLYFAFTVLG